VTFLCCSKTVDGLDSEPAFLDELTDDEVAGVGAASSTAVSACTALTGAAQLERLVPAR
jgi:hypothetical protein